MKGAEADRTGCFSAAFSWCRGDIGKAAKINDALLAENLKLRSLLEHLQASSGSESRLKQALLSPTVSSTQLAQAIQEVEVFMQEARRELSARQLRERRAAYEHLYQALEKTSAQDGELSEALEIARSAGVDAEDLCRAEERLSEMKARSPEERAIKASIERERVLKKEAFLLIKRDDADALQKLLLTLEDASSLCKHNVSWKDWTDHAGRNLWRCSQDLKASKTEKVLRQHFLQPLHGISPKTSNLTNTSCDIASASQLRLESDFSAAIELHKHQHCSNSEQQSTDVSSCHSQSPTDLNSPTSCEEKLTTLLSSTDPWHFPTMSTDKTVGQSAEDSVVTDGYTWRSRASLSSDTTAVALDAISSKNNEEALPFEEEQLRIKAFRAVVKDDCEVLNRVLEQAPHGALGRWRNKAGKDLLTLSQERGSSCAYSVLAKALGMLKEMKREHFEERESVWVFLPGDVQPRRATVLEAAAEETESVLLEFWDGDDPAERVERCLVRRMWS